MDNGTGSTGFILSAVIALSVGLFIAFGVIGYNDRYDTYINDTFPHASQYYENVVTEKSNDYFVVNLNDGVEETVLITIDSQNGTHVETEVSDKTPSVQEMNETSLATDQRPKRSNSSNSWFPLWLMLR